MSLQWEREFIRVLDNHAPIRQRKVRNSYAPYIDRDLKHKMLLRDFVLTSVLTKPKILIVQRIRVKIALNVVKASKLVQMKLIT